MIAQNDQIEKYSRIAVIILAMFFYIQWEHLKTELFWKEKQQDFQIETHLSDVQMILFHVEETLNLYSFPIEDEKRPYFQDSLNKDIIHLHQVAESIQRLNVHSNFAVLYEDYLANIEELIKSIRGFQYTQAEIDTAIMVMHSTRADLNVLVEDRNFSVSDKEHREAVLEILNHFNQQISGLKKF